MNLTLPDFNFTEQINVIENFSDLEQGALYPAIWMWGGMQDIALMFVIVFTISIAYIRTDVHSPVAFITLLLTAVLVYIGVLGEASLVMKFAYVVAMMSLAAVIYVVFGKR